MTGVGTLMTESNIVETVTFLDQVARTPLVWFWRVPYYFQFVGILSIAVWVAAIVALTAWFGKRRVGAAAIFFFFAAVSVALWDLIDLPEFRWHTTAVRACVVALAVVLLWGDRRVVRYRNILALGLVALCLADVNSTHVSRIQPDRTKELEETRRKEEESRKKDIEERRKDRLADIQFAEDTSDEQRDLAGVVSKEKAEEGKSPYQLFSEGKITEVEFRERLNAEADKEEEADAPLEQENAAPEDEGEPATPAQEGTDGSPGTGTVVRSDEPAYRLKGKQERAAGRQETIKEFDRSVARDVAREGRIMSEKDMYLAQNLDRLNLFAVRACLSLIVLCVVMDYLRRLNRTAEAVLPLPLSGRMLDELCPKTHAVLLPARNREWLKGYMQYAVRKGETFLYFGEHDLWTRDRLLRFHLVGLVDLGKTAVTAAHRLLREIGEYLRATAGAYLRWETRHPAAAPLRLSLVRAGQRTGRAGRAVAPAMRIAGVRTAFCCSTSLALAGRLYYAVRARHPLATFPGALFLGVGGGVLRPLWAAVATRLRTPWRLCKRTVVGLLEATGLVADPRVSVAREQKRPTDTGKAVTHRRSGIPAHRLAARRRRRDRVLGLVRRGQRVGSWLWRVAVTDGWRRHLSKLSYNGTHVPPSHEFVLESAWFGRYCFCVQDRALAEGLLGGLEDFLDSRWVPRAAARRTVNLVWDRPSPPGGDVLDRLVFHCRESNMKLVMVADGEGTAGIVDLFDEVLEPTVLDEAVRVSDFSGEEEMEARKRMRWREALQAMEPILAPARRWGLRVVTAYRASRERRTRADARAQSALRELRVNGASGTGPA